MNENTNVETNYCRKCMNILPVKDFYESVDGGFIDSNGYMSICKNCSNLLYADIYEKTKSIEKALHKLCISLNIKYYSEAVEATKSHINTMTDKGKNVNAVFGIYKMKLVATQKSMDKSHPEPMPYEDVGSIYITETFNVEDAPIPEELKIFWGDWWTNKELQFLETQYSNFKKTHKADTEAEIVLLKEVCYTMLKIQGLRKNADETKNEVKELQELMKNLAISPNAVNNGQNSGKAMDTFGLWIKDIEKSEPAEWMKGDPRGDIYRDIDNIEKYFKDFTTRPLQNFITQTKDFTVDDMDNDIFDDEDLSLIDDGETGE